jgi:RNA polymerase sigma factor (sigma-70 family)
MSSSVGALIQFVRSHAAVPRSDTELLRCFAERHDQCAFAELVERHGPLVLGVCRRILRDGHEAEDAFQATFLLLSRKAASLGQPDRLGAWLHSVACRIARKALHRGWRRGVSLRPEHDPPMPVDANAEALRELRPVLDEAICALPAKYREPIVLCYLQGLTNTDAARRLGCPLGTIAIRLSRARDRLRSRLVSRGVVLPAALFPVLLSKTGASAAAPIGLCEITAGQAAGPVAAGIAQLIEGIGNTMLLEKSRWFAAAIVVMSACTFGLVSYHSGASEPAQGTVNATGAPENISKERPVKMAAADFKSVAATAEAPKEKPAAIEVVNFAVECSEPRSACVVAEMAELQRKQIAERWLGKELPNWGRPCTIQVTITPEPDFAKGASKTSEFGLSLHNTKGVTSMTFQGDNVGLSMTLEGPLDRLLADTLPREVTHAVLATHFGKPVPRWADEGIAIMNESPEDQNRYMHKAWDLLAGDRTMKLKNLLPMREYPNDRESMLLLKGNPWLFYVQGYSLTRFLVERKERATLLGFVKDGMVGDWNKAAMKHYGFRDLDEMEETWKKESSKGMPAKTAEELAARATSQLPPGVGPTVGLALMVGENSQITVVRAESHSEPFTKYVPKKNLAGETSYEPVTTSRMAVQRKTSLHAAKDVKAFELDGRPIEKAVLLDRLKKETAVLLSVTGRIDPFYLRVIKPGTIILVIPEELPSPNTVDAKSGR